MIRFFDKHLDPKVYAYSYHVDYWSLGGLMYKLLVGVLLFNSVSLDQLQGTFPALLMQYDGDLESTFTEMFGEANLNVINELTGEELLDEHTKSFIAGLLTIDTNKRLGQLNSTVESVLNKENNVMEKVTTVSYITNHPFLKDIDWDAVNNKTSNPPYFPRVPKQNSSSGSGKVKAPVSCDFNTMLTRCDKNGWIDESDPSISHDQEARFQPIVPHHNEEQVKRQGNISIPDHSQAYFDDWVYVSPAEIEAECKRANITKKANSFLIGALFRNSNSTMDENSSSSRGLTNSSLK